MFKLTNTSFENFESEYKFILKKSHEALMIECKGFKSEAYSLYTNTIINIDNILGFVVTPNFCNISQEEILSKRNNITLLRKNICISMDRVRQDMRPNEELLIAELIYSIKSDCQYTRISKNGIFGVPSYPGFLEVYAFPPSAKGARGFIVVADWIGGLIQNVTPILITPEGALIFFDTENEGDIKVAVTLPYNIPKEEFDRCISILCSLAFVVVDGIQDKLPLLPEESQAKSTGEVIATELSKVSQSVSKGVTEGATKLGELVCKGSNELCHYISPGHANLNPNIKTGLEYARTGSQAVMKVSGMAFGVLSRATQYLAEKAAPHIKTSVNNLIPDEWKEKGKNGEISTVEQIALVTGSGLQGLVLLFDSLHDGAVTFGQCAARSSGQVMRHRYGAEIGQSTENALYAAGNLGMAAMVAAQFTKKGILKAAAAVTAKEVADKYGEPRGANHTQYLRNHKLNLNNVKHI